MRDVTAFMVLGDKSKKGATKKKLCFIPSSNTTTRATSKNGRSSAVKDSAANAYAGGTEFMAVALAFWKLSRGAGV